MIKWEHCVNGVHGNYELAPSCRAINLYGLYHFEMNQNYDNVSRLKFCMSKKI